MEKEVSQQQSRITDHLAQVVQAIQFERRTGELRVARGAGINTELGSITFVNGQISQAQIGPYQGPTALNILQTWERCAFYFSTPTAQESGYFLAPSQVPPQQSSPLQNQRQTGPVESTAPLRRYTPLPQEALNGAPFPPTAIPRATMSVVKAIALIEREGLPRSYRQILLQIDGRHSIHELILLVGCSPDEMYQTLQALTNLTIVRIA